jgi:hypothetical protein
MKYSNRNRLFLVSILMNAIPFNAVYAADSIQLKVKFEKGAVLREGPDIKSKKIATLKYGALLELLETDPKLQIVQLAMPVEGQWLKVSHSGQIGYIFSSLVENDALNKYECPAPQYSVKGIEISRPGMNIEFCGDGTYIRDNSYVCMGPCWEHGCWRFSAKRQLELLTKKVSETRGVGKPISCTHSCYHKTYKIISEPSNQEKWQAEQDLDVFGQYYLSKGKEPPGDAAWSYRKKRFTCRDSRH